KWGIDRQLGWIVKPVPWPVRYASVLEKIVVFEPEHAWSEHLISVVLTPCAVVVANCSRPPPLVRLYIPGTAGTRIGTITLGTARKLACREDNRILRTATCSILDTVPQQSLGHTLKPAVAVTGVAALIDSIGDERNGT